MINLRIDYTPGEFGVTTTRGGNDDTGCRHCPIIVQYENRLIE